MKNAWGERLIKFLTITSDAREVLKPSDFDYVRRAIDGILAEERTRIRSAVEALSDVPRDDGSYISEGRWEEILSVIDA